jgi:hypothetical protein
MGPLPPSTQLVGVNTNTSGFAVDPDGYTVTLTPPSGEPRTSHIAINGQITFQNVQTGSHVLTLSGVRSNCTISGGNQRTVQVTPGSNDFHDFTITCEPNVGSVGLFNGAQGDPAVGEGDAMVGTTVAIAGVSDGPKPFPRGQNVVFQNVPVGDRDVTVSGIPARCFLIQQPAHFGPVHVRKVSVNFGEQTSVTYRFDCTLQNGVLRVTGGASEDTDGYLVSVGAETIEFGTSSSYDFAPIPGGDTEVYLSDVAGHCVVANAEPLGGGLWRTIVTVVPNDVREVVVEIDCPDSGSILVLTPSTGEPHDQNGYLVTVDNETRPIFGAGQRFEGLAPGAVVEVRLDDVHANCTVSEPNPWQVTVVANAEIVLQFTVTCGPHPTPIDPAGVWNFHVEVTEARGVCSDLDVSDTPITITKSGSAPVWNVTASGFEGDPNNALVGTFNEIGNRLVISGNYPDDGGITTTTHDLLAATENELIGRESWDWSDGGGGTCPNSGSNVTATRIP